MEGVLLTHARQMLYHYTTPSNSLKRNFLNILNKKKREKAHIINIGNEGGDITTDPMTLKDNKGIL
jgi:hypothetical protein